MEYIHVVKDVRCDTWGFTIIFTIRLILPPWGGKTTQGATELVEIQKDNHRAHQV